MTKTIEVRNSAAILVVPQEAAEAGSGTDNVMKFVFGAEGTLWVRPTRAYGSRRHYEEVGGGTLVGY